MKIRTKIFWSAFIPGVILAAGAMIIFFNFSAKNLEDQIKSHLQTVVNERAEHIETFLTQNEAAIKLIASGFTFKKFLLSNKTDSNYEQLQKEAAQRLIELVNTKQGIISASLIDKDGVVVASSEYSRCSGANTYCLGMDESNEDIFIEGRKSFYIKDLYRMEDDPKEVVLDMSSPIFYNENFLGIVVAKISSDKLSAITSNIIGDEEAYLVNSDRYVITPLRSVSDAVLTKKIDTLNIKNCFGAMDVQESQYLSYKDVRHIGHEATAVFTGYDGITSVSLKM